MTAHRKSARSARVVLAGLLGALAPTLASCETDPTEVVLIVTSDFSVPSELDRLEVTVEGPDGTTQTATATLSAGDGLPRSLGLYNPSGPLGPFTARVDGFSGNVRVARRLAVFDFERDRSLEVEVRLLEACRAVTCLCSELFCSTCGEGGVCTNARVTPRPFDGVDRRFAADAGFDLP